MVKKFNLENYLKCLMNPNRKKLQRQIKEEITYNYNDNKQQWTQSNVPDVKSTSLRINSK